MISNRSRWALFVLAVLALGASANVTSIENLSLETLDEKLQTCSIVQDLNAHKAARAQEHSTFISRLFAVLFPGSPAVNALLATLYISGPPNFLLALCPTNIDPSSLTIMVAFAVGGLMGDTLFHLLPEIFLGEEQHGKVKFVLVEPNRNLLLGLAILVGFMTFVAMDKTLRILTGGAGHDHSHGHGHSHENEVATSASSSSVDTGKKGAKSRKKGSVEAEKDHDHDHASEGKEISPSMKMGGVLNLIADFTHNITDGLAMSASFYASPTVGASTTLAVFLHEIPHEVGDFALLVQSGFSKRAAMGAQFVTAIGAFLGTLIGIFIQEFGGSNAEDDMSMTGGIWGTSLTWGDMLLPFTAGTFLYVGTVAVIPELLETGPNKALELRKTLGQFAAVALGAGIMLFISWHD
ncbi:hypothetical protein SAPIO_CDS7251 [Scedosporium apiospermum]|uniref:ZIP Zinc transporter n=1 Tax=Pseudallescheria apiosperma TaxID=563466 RepID=A0A084G1F9_PSEDA|nr:uncharacterized protein SAPIO_CDS7251 [Scedosporium apiospermum]KEZ41171.1 hypothetical protein SAPIO_CDS7251 [Scedosporium apiospermum]